MPEADSWHCLRFTVPQALADDIADQCHQLGSCGLQVEDRDDSALLTAYFDAELDAGAIQAELGQLLDRLDGDQGIERERVERQNWAAGWREFFQPVWATPKIVVRPPWIPVVLGPDQVDIAIEPKMAFGTGGHESTQLCLQGLEQVLRPGDRCLDLGTGSGVLAIAAARLGAGAILALDVDPEAVANARENIHLNGLDEAAIEVRQGRLEDCPEAAYRLILANIQSHTLRPLLEPLRQRLQKGGEIVFAGLLAREEESFCQSMEQAGLVAAAVWRKKNWIALLGQRAD